MGAEGESKKTGQLCSSGAARPVDAPPPRRPAHVNRSGATAQLVAVGATWLTVQLLHKPLLQQPRRSVCLGVAWSPRPDTCAQRDGCSVEWLANRVRGLRRYWTARASWGVTRPISGRCVYRRGLVVVGGRGQHTRPNFTFPLWPQWTQFHVITGEQRQQQINTSELLVVLLSSAYLCNNVKYTILYVCILIKNATL